MKKFVTLILCALITTMTFGQSNYQDVIYLNNGGIVRGIIIEQIPNKSLKIETADRSVFVYQMAEIEKFTKEPFQDTTISKSKKLNFQSGYRGIIELGEQIGIGEYGMDRIFLNIINGYQINSFFFIGFGTGLRYYYTGDDLLIPVFADFKANLTDSKVSPYVSLGLGYSFNLANNHHKTDAGYLLNPNVGINFNVSNKSVMNIGFGFEMQKMEIYDSWNIDKYYENSGAICFNVGISF